MRISYYSHQQTELQCLDLLFTATLYLLKSFVALYAYFILESPTNSILSIEKSLNSQL